MSTAVIDQPSTKTHVEPIHFTASATARVAELVEEQGIPDLKLRILVRGGGCSGFEYGFVFDEAVNADDLTVALNGASVLIDAVSYQHLLGAEIDCCEAPEGAQFIIDNPNAPAGCSCGACDTGN